VPKKPAARPPAAPAATASSAPLDRDAKQRALDRDRVDATGARLTTDQGVRVEHTDDSLRPGPRGPTLLEDFHLREKLTRFDHERIPERVVHARGAGAHGFFQAYEGNAALTRAAFLCDTAAKTPVFARFSTVGGSRGSTDLARDVRGFAVKFYTSEGNFDLVGNNIPVFFIQDGIKFPDFVHAVKPEPHHEMPQASSAHDSFWDFVGLVPETLHMVLWLMSDRALPRSFRTMQGFGVHTFRLVDAAGESRLVKFHWKPLLGLRSLLWEEAQLLSGKDPDFHRRDLWEAIASGAFPEWELGVQVVTDEMAASIGVDLLDATKIIPEELAPVRPLGKMTLDRNPTNFFAETEQVAFCVANLVPGVDVTDDPLMQARLFSYLDTQLTRLGGPNFAEIPINRPVCPVVNHQQDGLHRDTIPTSRANYHPNSTGGGCPFLSTAAEGGYVHVPEAVSGAKARRRSETFGDHVTQAALFFRSLTAHEQDHIVDAFRFELAKVEIPAIRERVVAELARVDRDLVRRVAAGLGVTPPDVAPVGPIPTSPALRLDAHKAASVATRTVAALCADGVDADAVVLLRTALAAVHARLVVVAPRLGPITVGEGDPLVADRRLGSTSSVEYDAVYVPGGAASVAALAGDADAVRFLAETFRHAKAIAASDEGAELLGAAGVALGAAGVVVGQGAELATRFVTALAEDRHWRR
jgi:catalase